jgi:hypothetical protein
MSNWLLALVGLIYAFVAGSCFRERDYGMVIVFAAYALANLGLIVARHSR